jgi:hypothetical protein
MRRIALAALVLVASTGLARPAEEISEAEFRNGVIQMNAGIREPMQDVATLIACLRAWSPGAGPRDNKVEITRTGADRFTISVSLRSQTNMYFEVAYENGSPISVLRRVEYRLPERDAYQQITDPETKRAVLHSACPRL